MPYERLKTLPNASQYLKKEITFAQLDELAYACSDNEFAQEMQKARSKLEKLIKNAKIIEK